MDENLKEWKVLVACCHSLPLFNRFVIPLAKGESQDLRQYVANEAARRGYRFNREKGKYE